VRSLIVLRGQDVDETDVMGISRAVPAGPSLTTLMIKLLVRVP
jgi:hypothetical protein